MRYDSMDESGIWITVKDGRYFFKLPSFLADPAADDGSAGLYEPGFFLTELFNTDFTDTMIVPVILDDLLTAGSGSPEKENALKISIPPEKLQKIWDNILIKNPALRPGISEAIQNAVNSSEYDPGIYRTDDIQNVQYIQNMSSLPESDIESIFNDILLTFAGNIAKLGKPEKHHSYIAELFMTQLYDTIKSDEKTDYIHFSDGFDRLSAYSNMILDGIPINDRCRKLISCQMPRVRFIFMDGQMVPEYYLRTMAELFALDVYYYMPDKKKYSFCKLCGRYFKKVKRNTEAYCNRPNIYFNDMSCSEYHLWNPKYKDVITELSRRAEKTQNKYCSNHPEKENQAEAYGFWAAELKKRTHEARVTRDIEPLKRFIRDTRFSKIGFSVTDYSVY